MSTVSRQGLVLHRSVSAPPPRPRPTNELTCPRHLRSNSTNNCYIDTASACDEPNAVECTNLAPGVTRACCPRLTACHPEVQQRADLVRCNIQYGDLLRAATAAEPFSSPPAVSPSSTAVTSGGIDGGTATSTGPSTRIGDATGIPVISSAPSSTTVGMPPGMVAGIVIALVASLLVGGGLAFLFLRHRRRTTIHGARSDDGGVEPKDLGSSSLELSRHYRRTIIGGEKDAGDAALYYGHGRTEPSLHQKKTLQSPVEIMSKAQQPVELEGSPWR